MLDRKIQAIRLGRETSEGEREDLITEREELALREVAMLANCL